MFRAVITPKERPDDLTKGWSQEPKKNLKAHCPYCVQAVQKMCGISVES